MKIDKKITQLKTTIQEIKKISESLDDDNIYKKKIDLLNKELLRLKKGISESVDELEEFLKEQDGRS